MALMLTGGAEHRAETVLRKKAQRAPAAAAIWALARGERWQNSLEISRTESDA